MIEKSSKFLIDSNIFIYHLNGEEIATTFLKKNFKNCLISRVTYIEVLSFDFTVNQESEVIELLKLFKTIDTTDEIAVQSLKNRKIKKVKIADNIIASTAQVNHLILVTRNTKDFNSLNIDLLNPFEN